MPRPYTQLLLVNMLLAVLISTTVLGAPLLPALAGAIGAGALLHARRKRKERSLPSTTPPERATKIAVATKGEHPVPNVAR